MIKTMGTLFQKYVIMTLSALLVLIFMPTAYSANSETFWIAAGEVKHIKIPMKGALGVSGVSVSGSHITSSIAKKFPDSVEVKVVANQRARAGLRKLSLKLQNKKVSFPFYIFGLTSAKISLSKSNAATRLDVYLSSNRANLKAYAHRQPKCLASTTEDSHKALPIYQQAIQFKKAGPRASLWISGKQPGGWRCRITITESYPELRAELSRDVLIEL